MVKNPCGFLCEEEGGALRIKKKDFKRRTRQHKTRQRHCITEVSLKPYNMLEVESSKSKIKWDGTKKMGEQ